MEIQRRERVERSLTITLSDTVSICADERGGQWTTYCLVAHEKLTARGQPTEGAALAAGTVMLVALRDDLLRLFPVEAYPRREP